MTETAIANSQNIEDIGQALLEAREAKDISIASAAMQTNLKRDVLTKLENNQFAEVGAPVFTRGYLNIYARFLGLDGGAITQAFNEVSQGDGDIRLTPANVASQAKSFKRYSAWRWLILLPLCVVAGLIVMQVIDSESWLMQQVRSAFPAANEQKDTILLPANDIVLEIEEGGEVQTISNIDAPTLPVLTSLDEDANPVGVEEQTITLTIDDGNASSVVETLVVAPVVSTPAPIAQVETPVEATPTAQINPVVNGQLRISNENWVEVKNSAGKVIASRIYTAGQAIDLPASGSPYTLNIGRPNDASLSIAGQAVTLRDYQLAGSARLFKVVIE